MVTTDMKLSKVDTLLLFTNELAVSILLKLINKALSK